MIGNMKIKICGITTIEEALWLNEIGVDYAGFVLFFEKSKRNIELNEARKILSVLDESITSVAVTVQPTLSQIQEIEEAGFGVIQIHGKIPEKDLAAVRIPVWKAFNVRDISGFEEYERMDNVVGYVFDAQTPGSGKTFDWTLLEQLPKSDKQIMLAGGLGSENVVEAIRFMGEIIDGVDTSSGVEKDTGIGKDKKKIEQFVRAILKGEG